MEDTAETHKKDLEQIRQETQAATGQPVEDVGSPEDSIPIISGLINVAEGGRDEAKGTLEELGRGIFGGGVVKTTEDTRGWRNILGGKFRKQAEDRGGEVVPREDKEAA